jgi:hypothetical protein
MPSKKPLSRMPLLGEKPSVAFGRPKHPALVRDNAAIRIAISMVFDVLMVSPLNLGHLDVLGIRDIADASRMYSCSGSQMPSLLYMTGRWKKVNV